MHKLTSLSLAVAAAALVAACSDGTGGSSSIVDGSGARGSLIQNPPLRIATLTAADFTAELNATPTGQQLLGVVSLGTPTPGALPCGVDFHYIQYGTVDGGNPALPATTAGSQQPTSASGALMVPTGPVGICSGPRPILLYAHGTATDRNTNLADITNPNNAEGALIAAMFAAYGYIVVAPNYAGYDSSPLPYHPFLNADQQSKEMIDALTAARKALGNISAAGTTDNGKLFVTGYSQGGFVALATMRALQAAAISFDGAGPMSGPYALVAFGDAVFSGKVNLGSTVFAPMIAASYQRQFGNIYTSATDTTNIFAAPYAATIDALLPSTTPLGTLFAQNKLPQTTLFSSTPPTTGGVNPGLDTFFANNTPPTTGTALDPLFAAGFGATNLITNNARLQYVADAGGNPDGTAGGGAARPAAPPSTDNLRLGLYTNDLRTGWAPAKPLMLCGGGNDPTVFFLANTVPMGALLGLTGNNVLDVDTPVGGGDTPGNAAAKQIFAGGLAAAGGLPAAIQLYHGTLVPPACAFAVRAFFAPL